MSVNGEFVRSAEKCLAFVGTHASRNGAAWCAAVDHACERASEDLSAAARAMLDAHESVAPPGFTREEDRDAFGEKDDHLLSICRIILGS